MEPYLLFIAMVVGMDGNKPVKQFLLTNAYVSRTECVAAATSQSRFNLKSGQYLCEPMMPGMTLSIPVTRVDSEKSK